jgi:rhamnulose-1-phosphate aldolase
MKDILTAPFVKEMCDTTANMYRLGWDERNGGNISYMLDEEEIAQYLDINHVLREIPTGFKADALIGRIFIVTGTGKYFKNVKTDPENNLGIIRIAEDGTTAQLLWGYKDGGKFTSELPAHLMSHMARLSVDKDNRVVIHSHPTNTLAMNYVHELDEKKFTHTLWEMCTECIVVFPDGVGILPWMLCGTNEIGEATAEKMKELVETFYDLSILEEQQTVPEKEKFNISNMLINLITENAVALEKENILPEINLPDYSIYVYSDKNMVERILQNLLTNAIKYSVGTIKITLMEKENNNIIFTIENPMSDSSEIDCNRLFDRFYTGDKSRHNGSTGLGLAVVKTLVAILGGNIVAKVHANSLIITLEL